MRQTRFLKAVWRIGDVLSMFAPASASLQEIVTAAADFMREKIKKASEERPGEKPDRKLKSYFCLNC